MKPDEQAELDALAKVITAFSYPPASVLPLYAEAVDLLALAWAKDYRCTMCGQMGPRHPCACAHNQARKWAKKRGMWPLDRQAA